MLVTSGNEIKIWSNENYCLINEYELKNQKPINSFSLRSDSKN
jgi:hypothetical protein